MFNVFHTILQFHLFQDVLPSLLDTDHAREYLCPLSTGRCPRPKRHVLRLTTSARVSSPRDFTGKTITNKLKE